MDANSAELIVISMLAARAISPLIALSTSIGNLVDIRISFQRFIEFNRLKPVDDDSIKLPDPIGELNIKNLTYSADNNRDFILRGVTFDLSPGEILAVIGPTGAGKSTLAKLLLGIIKSTHGEVRLDGVDIFDWQKSQLGKFLGYVSPDTDLFNGSLKQNISRFNPTDDIELERVINVVGLKTFLEKLPNGIESELGTGANQVLLSFGQAQQIAIARAIYGNPKFVVMDEPNSNLDVRGDKALLDTINYLRSIKCTTVIVTHRAYLLENVDKILVLSNGAIKAFGPAQDILNQSRKNAKK